MVLASLITLKRAQIVLEYWLQKKLIYINIGFLHIFVFSNISSVWVYYTFYIYIIHRYQDYYRHRYTKFVYGLLSTSCFKSIILHKFSMDLIEIIRNRCTVDYTLYLLVLIWIFVLRIKIQVDDELMLICPVLCQGL